MIEKCRKMSLEESPSPEVSKELSCGSAEPCLSQPWDKLLEDTPSPTAAPKIIPKIVRTRASFADLREEQELLDQRRHVNLTPDPNTLSPNRPPPPGVGRLTRTQSLGGQARKSGGSLLGNFQRQLRYSLRSPRGGGDKDHSGGPLFRYRQARYASRRIRRRIVFKHGDCNIVQGNVAKRRKRYLQDLFTTLVDAQWRWTLLVFAMSFVLSWLGFGVLWWLIAYAHGDLDSDHAAIAPCVIGVDSFASGFLFSVETQHTIGYGVRAPTVECPEAIFIMCLQSIVGVFIQAFMVGIVFSKLSRPKKRAQTLLFSDSAVVSERDGRLLFMFQVGDLRKSHIVEAHVRAQLIKSKVGLIFAKLARAKKRTTTLLFSRNAVVCLRDGMFCLLFRVGDIRKSHILEAHVRAQIIRKKVTREGELLPFYQQELKVGADGEEDRLMFIWPTTIVHIINEDSPLYNLSASDMLRERFEIVVMLEGVIESTGMTTQARSSYLPSEIFWGHRFEPIVSFKKETGEYEVDYTLFNNTYEVDTPLCSAKQLDELRASLSSNNRAVNSVPVTLGCAPSNDTLDSCSVDSMSLDEQIEIKIPDVQDGVDRHQLLESQSDVSGQNIIGEEKAGTPNGLVNGHHLHHHHHHHNHHHPHHNNHHPLLNGLNGSMQHLHANAINGKLSRTYSGQLTMNNKNTMLEVPDMKIPMPISIVRSESTPPPDLV